MPLYEYECASCGASFEALIQGDSKPACRCGSRKLKKRFSTFAVSTTGGGGASASMSGAESFGGGGGGGCGSCGDPRGPGSCDRND